MNIFSNAVTATENITCFIDRVFLGKLTGMKKSRNSPHFMEPDGSLHNTQVPAPVPILRQLDAVRTTTSYFLKINKNIFLHLLPFLPIGVFPPRFPTLYTQLRSHTQATCPPSISFCSILSPAKLFCEKYIS